MGSIEKVTSEQQGPVLYDLSEALSQAEKFSSSVRWREGVDDCDAFFLRPANLDAYSLSNWTGPSGGRAQLSP